MASRKKVSLAEPPHHYSDLKDRKGARRRSEVDPRVLEGLHAGRLETVNLVEWLAIDAKLLLANVLTELEIVQERDTLLAVASALEGEGVNRRTEGIAKALYDTFATHRRRKTILRALACHDSDTVRVWSANIVGADPNLSLHERLEAIRPLAADHHFGVRECAWMALRPHLVRDLAQGLALLRPWVQETDPNLRRFAIEAIRPRGVWCAHIPQLREQPEDARLLLEAVRSDSSRYVQLSVANWLNDASKTRPDFVEETCARWLLESRTTETAWIVHHARRTLRKGTIPKSKPRAKSSRK